MTTMADANAPRQASRAVNELSRLLFTLVRQSERHDDSFCGLFVYRGRLSEPPSNEDALVQLMQASDGQWIAFADDQADCSQCSDAFPQCEQSSEDGVGAEFCHRTFDQTPRGTVDAVIFLARVVQASPKRPHTAFVCSYNPSSILDETSDSEARIVMRAVLGDDTPANAEIDDAAVAPRSRLPAGQREALYGAVMDRGDDVGATVDLYPSSTSCFQSPQTWLLVAGAVASLLVIIVAIVVCVRKRRSRLTNAKATPVSPANNAAP